MIVRSLWTAGFALVVGCSAEPKAEEKAEQVIEAAATAADGQTHVAEVQMGANGGTAVSIDGNAATLQPATALPADWSAEFPAYPGATVTQAGTATAANGSGAAVVLQTADAPDQVLAFYRTHFASLKLVGETAAPIASLKFQRADGTGRFDVMVMPAVPGQPTTVALFLGK